MFGHDPRELAAVFIGGALGTLARALLAVLAAPAPGHWPWPTFIVNIVGAFLLLALASLLVLAVAYPVLGLKLTTVGIRVEVHGANGYLLDQFMRDLVRLRAAQWGQPH